MNSSYHVVAAVIQSHGRYLCVRRGITKYPYTSFKYEFPGGKIEKGESEEEALKREIEEELKASLIIDHKMDTVFYKYPDFEVTIEFYLCHLEESSHYILMEHESSLWATISEMKDLDWVAADKCFILLLSRFYNF